MKARGCKCRLIQLGQRQFDRLGAKVGTAPADPPVSYTNARIGETQQIPAGVDPAFAYPAGGRLASLGRMLADKVEQAPATLGAGVFKSAAPTSMPLLMQSYTTWGNAVEAGGGKVLGGRRVISSVSPWSIAALAAKGISQQSAGLSLEQRDVTHLFAAERKGAKAAERGWIYALPERLAAPDAVIYDATPGKEALLYVWKDGERYVRVVVRPNFRMKGENYTNAVRSAQNVERRDLQGKRMTLLEDAVTGGRDALLVEAKFSRMTTALSRAGIRRRFS